MGFAKSTLIDYPTPKNLNYWWTGGAILVFMGATDPIAALADSCQRKLTEAV